MFDTFKNRLELTGILQTVTALRVSQGRSLEPIGSDLPVIKDALGRPLIPGSSFKGALRSRLESFLRGIDESLAANPAIEAEWAIPFKDVVKEGVPPKKGMDSLKKEADQRFRDDSGKESKKDQWLTEQILDKTDCASLLFGSPWMASKFQVRDLTVLSDTWFGQYQERDGVSIDRDTETAAEGKLYDFQVVPAGTPFEFKAVVENAEEWELGLLMIGLHQFETEQIPLGGGRSRGLGVVRLENLKMRWVDVRRSGDPSKTDVQKMQNYLKALVSNGSAFFVDEDISEKRQEWAQKFVDSLPSHIRRLTQFNPKIKSEQPKS
jgi:CRISPR-associated RAMP protein (TIGR02581 family)